MFDAIFSFSPFLKQLQIGGAAYIQAFMTMLVVSFVAMVLMVVAGTPLGAIAAGRAAVPRIIVRILIDTLRGVPLLVLVFAVFYLLPMTGFHISATVSGIVSLGLFGAAHFGEIMRGGLLSIHRGQREAAMAIGLTPLETFISVLFPQALRVSIPATVSLMVELVKATPLLALVGVKELLLTTQQVVARSLMGMEFYMLLGIVFLVINLCISALGAMMERRFNPHGMTR